LQLLVTSRQVLRLRGEREFPLTPLPVPPLEGPNDLIRTNPAVRLFVQQAKAAQPKFELTSDNLASVAEICRRLDGLPLAVELAAARVRLLPPDLLLTRLETRLDLLSSGAADLPERQRTLLNTIDWSYNLLGPEEQALFAQLAIFADGWTLDAAEDVCTVSSGDVLDVLVALLEKSLLVVVSPSQAGEPRMRMLGPVHQYAEQKLVASDERATLQQRHAEYFAKLVEEHHSEIRSQDQESWSLRLSTEAGNLRAAAEWWLAKSDGEALGRFLWATNLHYWLSGNLQELSRLVRATKPLVDCMSRGTLGRFRIVQGYDARNFGAIDEAAKNFEEAISLLESQGDDFGIGLARLVLSETRNWLGDSRAAGDLEEVFANPVLLGDPWLRAMALWIRAECALTVGDLEQAQLLASQAVDPARELGSWVGQGLERAGFIYVQAGRPDAASAALKEAVACFRHMHYREGLAHCLQSLASLLLMFGDAEAAAQALAAAEATHELIGASMWPMYRPNFDALRNQLQTILGDQFEDVWRRGNSIDVYRSTDNALAALALVEG
jgi:predicted ATPase